MNQNKTIMGVVGAVAISLLALVLAISNPDGSQTVNTPDVGGQRSGQQSFVDGATLGSETVGYVSGTIEQGISQGSWKNNLGVPVYVDLVEVRNTAATASTSAFILDVGTSTTATIAYSGATYRETWGTLVNGRTIASSTPANTVISNIGNGLTRRQVIRVEVDEYVVFTFVAPELCSEALHVCDTATTTSRGFNLDWKLRYNFKPKL
jgi:hypothetical protein